MSTPAEEARAALDAAVEEALDSYATDMVLLWSRESDEANTSALLRERELLKQIQEQRVELVKLRGTNEVLVAREELVQEVIAAKLVHDERGDLEPLIKAAEKLAGWKP
jgi:hypothetical protein